MPKIIPLMTVAEIENEAEKLIAPENGDEQAAALIRIIYEVANFENPAQANLAMSAARFAYLQTSHYDRAFKKSFREFIESASAPVMNLETRKSDELRPTDSSLIN